MPNNLGVAISPVAVLRTRLPRRLAVALVVVVSVAAVVVVSISVDTAAVVDTVGAARDQPGGVAVALGAFGLAFVLRAWAWRLVLPQLGFGHALAGIHLALGGNHVLPLRLGEPLRVASVVRRAGTGLSAATASTVALRATDLLTVVVLGLVAAPAAVAATAGGVLPVAVAAVCAAALVGWLWLRRLAGHRGDIHGYNEEASPRQAVRPLGQVLPGAAAISLSAANPRQRTRPLAQVLPGAAAISLSAFAWLAESVLVWQAAHWAGLNVTPAEAMGVTAVSVAAQVAAIAPGGFGTYEAAAVAAYVALGHDAGDALVAALAAHAAKTAYSVVAGVIAMFVPSPSLAGHLRLRRRAEPPPATHAVTAVQPAAHATTDIRDPLTQPAPTDAGVGMDLGNAPIESRGTTARAADPVVLFMPAHNEEESVAGCVRRAPASVCGHPVRVLVISDGSTDATACRARAAGAEVIELSENRGLGAAVRLGLAASLERDAVAVAFCDADGEYPPEELAALVTPIISGDADYVVGSRFLGKIEHMRPHRRVGNLVLTRILSIIARERISDGQSGYRAFSRQAAAHAEIIHDFNYAQVITLDLLAKGYRYAEVPISYRFRTTGQSFVKLGPYLRRVIPAVHRELNAP